MDAEAITPELIEKWTCGGIPVPEMGFTLYTDWDLDLGCPLDNGRHTKSPIQNIGQLSLLPAELLTIVLLNLDIPSLTVFRRVNQRAMCFVDSIHQYSMVYRHCPDVLRSILTTEAKHFDFQTLSNTLCEMKCNLCGDFGNFLYLVTCTRICFQCLRHDTEKLFLPMRIDEASTYLGWSRAQLEKLPHIRSFETYSTGLVFRARRTTLWDRRSVLLSSTATQPADAGKQIGRFPTELMSAVPVPYFLPHSNEAIWGVYCLGCCGFGGVKSSTKQYSRQGFVDHVVRYGPVVLGEEEGGQNRHMLPEQLPKILWNAAT